VALARTDKFDPSFDPATGTARGGTIDPSSTRSATQIDACGRCHSRRTPIAERYEYGRPLLGTHDLALLDENLYHPDGQIRDEVFEVGSFLESKMYRHGVVCSDCHEPHAATLRATGDALCTRCHDAGRFAQPAHHHHKPDSAAARCVNCHMPTKTYMGVDERRDHSLRIPRPDLSAKLGTPNPCTSCHAAKSHDWAARAIVDWTGHAPRAHWAEAIEAGRRGAPDAPFQLTRVIDEEDAPPIARATALGLLARQGGVAPSEIAARVAAAEGEADPLIRRAAATAGEALDGEERWRLISPLLSDDLLGVRIEAARVLAPLVLQRAQSGLLAGDERQAFDRAAADFRSAQETNAEHPEAHLNLGWLAAQLGDLGSAESSFRRAIALDPGFLAARINLAEIFRQTGRDADGETVLREALARDPQSTQSAAAHHALGLLLVRRNRLDEALGELERAKTLAPNEPRYAYAWNAARQALEAARPSPPAPLPKGEG
jgi:predicted CXXCH cytochrome family protein